MAAEKAIALVVRGTDWSETSRIATLFTREFGKVRALAKGGRRLKSNFDVAFDLLTVCQIVFLRKAHGGLDLLTEARLEEQFPALRANLPALYAGYYVAELLADGTQDYDPHAELFDAALAVLRELGAAGDPHAPVSAFELVWLRELGYSPRLDACAGCGRERRHPEVGALFSAASGGVLCPECGPTAPDRRAASGPALSAMRALAEGARELPPDVRGEVRQLLGQTVSCVLGRRPRMLAYVDAR
jgi:DNA repair protein RecO (recombination protein O)